MDQVIPESFKISSPAVSPSMSVSAGVLKRPVMSLPLVGVVRLVESVRVSEERILKIVL